MKPKRKDQDIDTKEIQYIDVAFEVKAIEDLDDGFFRFEGLASTFGNIDLVDDIVVRGAFKESIETKTPVVLWQHDSRNPLGMPEEIRETEEGLFLKAKLPKDDTFVSGRVIPQIKVGSIRSMSIGFRIIEREFTDEGIRLLKKVNLLEVSLVTFPANTMAKVSGFKNDEQFFNVEDVKSWTKRDLEKALRESGAFSKDAAQYIVKDFTEQGEPDSDESDFNAMLENMSGKMDDHLKASELSILTQKVNSYGS